MLSALAAEVARHHADDSIDLVAGPTTGGIIIAFEVARQMNLSAIYVETEAGQKKLRRGRVLPPGARVLVVDDVLTTGRSLLETREVIEGAGASVAAYAVLIDRSEEPISLGAPLFAAHRAEGRSWASDEIPESLRDVAVSKPGSRS